MPTDANTALFVIWVCDADFVNNMANYTPYNATKLAAWTNAMNQTLSNQFVAINNLYNHGARTFVLPNAVDMTEIPSYYGVSGASKSWVRQRIVDFNTAFSGSFSNQIVTNCPGVTIYMPDIFSLLDYVTTNAAAYGLTNAGVDVISSSLPLSSKTLNGPGTNYIFWDPTDPTAKFHAAIGWTAFQTMLQPQINKLTLLSGSNQLDVANVPVGLPGLVYGSSNCVSWTIAGNVDSTSPTESIFVPSANSPQFYRLFFPFAATWP
jgi:phospholipase/lecithinase/hemolysin